MKVNKDTAISSEKVLLVPYEGHHVRKYHSWMQDPDIQEATASEPLTIEEEYENQQSWRSSRDKLTFILCAPQDRTDGDSTSNPAIKARVDDSDERMLGDVNFFLNPYDAQEGAEEERESHEWVTGEVDIMVAEKGYRGSGVGMAAVTCLLCYIYNHLDEILTEYGSAGKEDEEGESPQGLVLKNFMVKIGEWNKGSRALFSKLGFEQRGPVNYFGEITMVLAWERARELQWWANRQSSMREVEYIRE